MIIHNILDKINIMWSMLFSYYPKLCDVHPTFIHFVPFHQLAFVIHPFSRTFIHHSSNSHLNFTQFLTLIIPYAIMHPKFI